MTLGIIGAGAGIGLNTVHLALENGHQVVALSTNIDGIADHPRLNKIKGSAVNTSDVKNVMNDVDAILITVGTKNKKKTTLFSDIAKTLVLAAEEMAFNKPVLVITGFGAGDSKPYLDLFMRTVIRLFLKDQYADKSLMEEIITGSNLNWEIIRPGMLGDKQGNREYEVVTKLYKGMKLKKINRSDVAEYLVKEAVEKRNLKQKVTLTGVL